jgi:hypothetical protein
MIAVKIECGCGQMYAFDVEPVDQAMALPVYCPVCGADGTSAANQTIADYVLRQSSEELNSRATTLNSRRPALNRSKPKITARPSAMTPVLRKSANKWLSRLIVCATMLLIVFASVRYVRGRRDHVRNYAGAPSAQVARDGIPRTLAELNTWYVEPQATQNAATIYLQAFESMQTRDFSKVPLLGRGTLPAPASPLSLTTKSSIVSLLAANSQTLLLLARGAGFEESRYPVDLTRGTETAFPHLPKLRSAALLLELAAVQHADTHQGKEAADDVASILALGRSLASEPSLLSQSVRAASISVALTSWERTLNRTEVPTESLTIIAHGFAKQEGREADGDNFNRGVIAECINWMALMREPGKLVNVLTLPGVNISAEDREQLLARLRTGDKLSIEQAQLENASRQFIAARNQPFPQRLKADELIQQQISAAAAQKNILLGVILAGFAGQSAREAAALARLRLGMVASALEQFHIRNHNYPEDLSALVPEYLSGAISDPFDGEPVRYRKDPTGFTLHSVGPQISESSSARQPGQKEKQILFTVSRHKT